MSPPKLIEFSPPIDSLSLICKQSLARGQFENEKPPRQGATLSWRSPGLKSSDIVASRDLDDSVRFVGDSDAVQKPGFVK